MTNNRNIPDPWLENQLARLIRAASEREVGPGLQKIQDDLLAYVYATRDPRYIPGPPLCEMCAPSGECHTGGCHGGGYLAESPPEPKASRVGDLTAAEAVRFFGGKEKPKSSVIPTWRERCETHPEHQNGVIITSRMIELRMQEEIDALRAALEQRK